MKSINRKQFCKLISLLLVIALLCQYPLNAVAIGVNETEKILESEAPVLEENFDTEVTPLISTTEVPNFISQAQIEEYGHISRLSDEETLNTLVYLNRDGTKTKYIMDYPVKYIDENGDTKFVDLSLGETTTAFETTANDIVLSVAKDYTKGITLTYKDYLISLVAVPNSNRIESGIIGTAPITVATKNDNVITYNDVFGTDIDIRYSPVHNGVKEDIILHSYNGVNTFDFLLNTGGLGVYSEKDNYYLAEAANADMRMDLGKVIVYDANRRISEGSLAVTTLKENQLYQVTVSVDQAFLTDPNTVYPVQIDPSITVSDTTHGANAVIDCPVYSGKPTVNMGNALYNPIGYLDSAYQIGRTAVKLVGLANDSVYQGLIADQIQSAYFYIRDSSGTVAKTINLYALIKNSTWTESSLTWNTLGITTFAVQASANVGGGAWSSFDITNLVKQWKSGFYDINCGFILQSSDESTAGNFFSSESSQSNWPYLVYSYVEQVSLSETSVSILEGGTKTLTATTYPVGGTVTWATSNSAVATVNSDGVITANKAGTANITASMTDSDGVIRTATCVVYVYIPNGVYYIKNLNSNYYLHVKNGEIANYSDVYQYLKYSDSTNNNYRIRQMWKIRYLGEGRYSVRPMNKLNMGLDVTSDNVDIYDIGETDLLSAVPPYGEWVIEWYSTGYVFKNNGNSNLTMQTENASTSLASTVVAQPFTTSANCRWEMSKISSPPSGAYWYNTSSTSVAGTSAGTKYLNEGSSSTASELGIVAVMYSGSSNNQTFTWSSNNPSVASVNSSSGLISANLPGTATITATSQYGGYKITFNLQVKSLDPFHSSNIQYMRFVQIKGTNWLGLGGETDHTINIVKSTLLADDYCVIHDNINTGYYRALYINDELKTTLNNLEAGYQEHYSIIPLFDTTTTEENAAHSAKGETDQLVDAGYFTAGSSEYYGVWAYNYVSSLNLLDYWKGVIDTATAAFQVYLTLTTFYYSYISTLNTNNIQVTSTQYQNASSVLDDIDDAMYGMNYTNRTTVSADSRNTALAQQGYTSPLPYKPQTPAVQYQQTSSTQYVRVFTTGSNGNKIGRWLMKYSDIQGLTPAQIQSKFALPSTPTHYCFVNVPAGTTIYVGAVNGSSVSGTLQYELATQLAESYYGIEILLP